MIPGVNSHLCTKILQSPALALVEPSDKTLQLYAEGPLQHRGKGSIRTAGVLHMHIYSLTNSENRKQKS